MDRTTFKSMIQIFGVFVLCMILSGIAAPTFAQPANENLSEKVDAYITETMCRLPIPGLAVGIVKGDQVLYLHGFGTANIHGDTVTPQTPFLIGSITKTFTALAVHQLAANGKLDLDKPLQIYIPEFRLADEQAATAITIRHLLDHTSGITTVEGTEPYLYSRSANFQEALNGLARFRPRYKPGEHYEYSNWNYVLLGQVITRVSGESYAEYVQKNIFDPLEMADTSTADFHTIPGAATGNLITFGFSAPYDEKLFPTLLSAGNFTSSAEDMTHYLILFFNRGNYHEHELLPSQGSGWFDPSWNWQVGSPGDTNYGFSGGHESASANITLFPQQKVGVVALLNTRLDELTPGQYAYDIAFNIAKITMNSPSVLPSRQRFYTAWALIDGFILLMFASIIWQTFNLKNWRKHYQTATHMQRTGAWIGIIFDILICIGIFFVPNLLGSRWNIALHLRPDFALPLLTISVCLGALGIIKVVMSKI